VSVRTVLLSCVFLMAGAVASAQGIDDEACGALALHDFSASAGGAAVRFGEIGVVAPAGDLPGHCRVRGTIAPEVGFEVWLPVSDWNRRLLVAGCGGLCGMIMTAGMEDALIRGYATATTDMGHSNENYPDTRWAHDNPALEKDFAYRATHVTTDVAKAISRAYYGRGPRRAFFRGCSTGGRQGLVAAQRYPGDYDGIIAGAPFNQAWSIPHFFWAVQSNTGEDGRPILEDPELELLRRGALSACDGGDGLQDGVISDPLACEFDPADLVCKAGEDEDEGSRCLTAVQAEAAARIYDGARISDGRRMYPGGAPIGSEFTWGDQLLSRDDRPPFFHSVTQNWSQFLAYEPDPPLGSGPFGFDFDRDPARIAASVERVGFTPRIEAFAARGGKLLMYHGWADESFPGSHSIAYRNQVAARTGDRVDDFLRLFLVPGMTHCGGGPGAAEIDYLSALEAWVIAGQPPGRLTAYKRRDAVQTFVRQPRFPLPPDEIVYSRPVYPYPDVAHYSGDGDPDDAASFRRIRRDAAD